MINDSTPNNEIRAALRELGVAVANNAQRAKLLTLAREHDIYEKVSRSVVPRAYKDLYGKAQTVGDEVAELLRDADVAAVIEQNGIDPERWAGKNAGMVRMNLGNVLRGRIRRGDYVVIGDKEFNEEARDRAAA